MWCILIRLIAIILCTIFLTGCGKDAPENTTEPPIKLAESIPLEEYSFLNSEPVIISQYNELPIMKDGVLYGTLHINYVEKLGIWDINNYEVSQNGVRFSYAINCTINMEQYVLDNEMINVYVTPELESINGTCIGTTGYVGWSGFYDSIELYQNTTSGTCEVVLQPVVDKIEQYRYLKLNVTDATNQVVFDTLYVDVECLKNAPDGAQIKTIDDITTITSVNGAVYSIGFHDVYLEMHKVKNDPVLRTGNYKFYDFMYDINYVSGPTNDKEVLTYDSFNDNALVTPPILEVYSELDGTKLLNEVITAERLLWSNRTTTVPYVQGFPKTLFTGETATISSNRLIPDTTTTQPTYVRIVLKFPTEIKGCSIEEIRNFSGRYLVYQIPLSVRKLEEEPR